jgi:UDP-2,3-diacylglucosamine pyrophosphatase LpxH
MTEPKPDSLAVANEKLLEMGKVRPPTVCEPGSEAGATKEVPAIDQTGLVAIEPEKGAGVASLPDVSPKPVPSDYVSAPDALHRIRREMTGIFQRTAARVDSGELKLIGWGLTQPRVQKLAAEHEDKPWFFVGDIHGDFLAWHRLFERVRQEKDFRLCFLGDLVDRGPLPIECFAALLEAVELNENRILWILGNHDEGLRFSDKEKWFSSRVEPAEFAECLNATHDGITPEQLQAWGRLFINVCRRLPRAVLFPDGLLATHGGVPLQDRWDSLKTLEAFHHERALGDFTWSRATRYPTKMGWSYDPEKRLSSSDFEFGYKDLEGFCNKAAAIVEGFTVKRVVRGHDHVDNGFEVPANYKNIPLLTINGFGFNYLSNSVSNYRSKLALGVGVPGDLPRVEPVSYLPEEYTGVYPLTIK